MDYFSYTHSGYEPGKYPLVARYTEQAERDKSLEEATGEDAKSVPIIFEEIAKSRVMVAESTTEEEKLVYQKFIDGCTAKLSQ